MSKTFAPIDQALASLEDFAPGVPWYIEQRRRFGTCPFNKELWAATYHLHDMPTDCPVSATLEGAVFLAIETFKQDVTAMKEAESPRLKLVV